MTIGLDRKSNTHEVINAILIHLFKHEIRRHQQCIDAIARKGSVFSAFLHKGQTFRPSFAPAGARRSALPEHCWDDMELFLQDKTQLDWDSKAFWQVLFSLIHECTSLQEVRDALPDFVVELVPELAPLPRIEQEAFTLSDPRVSRQFQTQRERMELYATMQKNPSLAQLIPFYHYKV